MSWTVDAARVRVGLAKGDTSQDAALTSAMAIALAYAETYCDRAFLLQDEAQEFRLPTPPALTVRRYPLVALKTIAPLDPQANPPDAPQPVPASWRIDRRRGMVLMHGATAWTYCAGFVLTYTGGYDPLPADLEAALWMVFDSVWSTTPGMGACAGSQGAGAVRSFAIDGMQIAYDTGTSRANAGAGRVEGYGPIPAHAVGVLDFYRAETAALGG